jgi:hypothetical protein
MPMGCLIFARISGAIAMYVALPPVPLDKEPMSYVDAWMI